MRRKGNTIQVFEYDTLIENEVYEEGVVFGTKEYQTLLSYFDSVDEPCFSLVNKGIKFKSCVGVLQVGNLTIEVLPKIDRHTIRNKGIWHNILIDMLRRSGALKLHSSENAHLKLRNNSILDLYMALFVQEVEELERKGYLKQYRKKEGNLNSLKGGLHFPGQIRHNLVHKERFFVRYNTYDHEHQLHEILLECLKLVVRISVTDTIIGRAAKLTLFFPEQKNGAINEDSFQKLVFNRKSETYRKTIDIARLLLLNYHPDVVRGKNHVLALMFDMNRLWESFILHELRRSMPTGYSVKGQASKLYWKPDGARSRNLKPDIVLEAGEQKIVVDTKWKIPKDLKASNEDVRQMLAYNLYFGAKKSYLLYPGNSTVLKPGEYLIKGHGQCSVLTANILTESGQLNRSFVKDLIAAVI